MALTDKLTNIADAIRSKTGDTDLMTLEQMTTNISGITPKYEPVTDNKATLEIIGDAGNFSVNGVGQCSNYFNRKIEIGEAVSLSAIGDDFVRWEDDLGKTLSTSKNYNFLITSSSIINAVFVSECEGSSYVEFVNDYGVISAEGTYSADDTIDIPYGPSKTGYVFDRWSMTQDEIIAAINDGVKRITVRPIYTKTGDKASLNVYVDGAFSQELSSNDISSGEERIVEAPELIGKKIRYWTLDEDGTIILSMNDTYSIVVVKDTSLYVVYADESESVQYVPVIATTSVTKLYDGTKHKIKFVFTRSTPVGYSLVEQGFLFNKTGTLTNPTEETFIIGAEGITKAKGSSTAAHGSNIANVSVADDLTPVYARAYYIYTDDNTGNTYTTYGALERYVFDEMQ